MWSERQARLVVEGTSPFCDVFTIFFTTIVSEASHAKIGHAILSSLFFYGKSDTHVPSEGLPMDAVIDSLLIAFECCCL
jgi:hypothetical protein